MRSAVLDAVFEDQNEGTRFANVRWLVEPPMSFAALFIKHYSEMCRLREAHAASGYLVQSVFANQRLGPHAHLSADPGAERSTLVVGRHTACSLCLDQDKTVALRHLVVRVGRGTWGRPCVKVIDLSTGQGFDVEGAGRCDSVVCDGPLFVRVGSYSLFFCPTSENQEPWSMWPQATWGGLPPTVLEDRRHSRGSAGAFSPRSGMTSVILLPAAHVLGEEVWLKPQPAEVVGTLSLYDGANAIEKPVGADELDRGVLVGRYARCELKPQLSPAREKVSRVHLLLIREGDKVVAVDTASSNGSRCDGQRFAAVALPETATVSLGDAQDMRWTRAGASKAHIAAPALSPAPGSPSAPRRWTTWKVAGAVILGLVGLLETIGGLKPHETPAPTPKPSAPQECIDPEALFGTDSPELRLYLYQQVPEICFKRRWQEMK
jgi:hypothetical protein